MTDRRLEIREAMVLRRAQMTTYQHDTEHVRLLGDELERLQAEDDAITGRNKEVVLDVTPQESARIAAFFREQARVKDAIATLHQQRANHTITDAEFETKFAAAKQDEHAVSDYARYKPDGAAPPPPPTKMLSPFESENVGR